MFIRHRGAQRAHRGTQRKSHKAISLNEYTQVNGFRLRSTLDLLFQNGIFIAGDRLTTILILKLIRHFIASILAISDERMRIAAVLFLKTSIRYGYSRLVIALVQRGGNRIRAKKARILTGFTLITHTSATLSTSNS